MVKGISRQVIVVQSPDPKLFEQAIFILRDEAVRQGGVSDEALLKEARALLGSSGGKAPRLSRIGPLWACGGAVLTGLVWLISVLL